MGERVRRPASRLASAALVAGLAAVTAVSADDLDEQFRAVLARERIPGAALLVVRDARVQRISSYGLANVEQNVPVAHDTMFQTGSLGKQFTAAAVLLLQERGQISLRDPAARYLGRVPDSWAPITVRELLDHTSGLHDSEEDGGEIFELRREYTDEELVHIAQSYPLNYPPGARWKYSNMGYILAGIIVTRVTGHFYGDFLASEIFRPLGMRTARIISDADIIPHRAAGYLRAAGGIRNQDFASAALNATADGSLYLSVDDWAKWIAAMDRQRLLSPASWNALWERTRLSDGTLTDHGFCFDSVTIAARPALEFDGSWQGFRTAITRDPRSRTTVVVLLNLADADPLPLARAALAHALARLPHAELTPPAPGFHSEHWPVAAAGAPQGATEPVSRNSYARTLGGQETRSAVIVDAEESRRFVLAFFAELAAGNPACWERVSEDARWSLIARAADYPYESEYTKASYRRLVEGSGAEFPTGLRFTITGTTAEPERVALEAESYGYHRSGALYNNRYHLMVLLAAGKIATVREYLDSGHAAEVLKDASSAGARADKS